MRHLDDVLGRRHGLAHDVSHAGDRPRRGRPPIPLDDVTATFRPREADVRRLGRRPAGTGCATTGCTSGSPPPAYAGSSSTSTTSDVAPAMRIATGPEHIGAVVSRLGDADADDAGDRGRSASAATAAGRLGGRRAAPIPPPETRHGVRDGRARQRRRAPARPTTSTARVAAPLAGRPHADRDPRPRRRSATSRTSSRAPSPPAAAPGRRAGRGAVPERRDGRHARVLRQRRRRRRAQRPAHPADDQRRPGSASTTTSTWCRAAATSTTSIDR